MAKMRVGLHIRGMHQTLQAPKATRLTDALLQGLEETVMTILEDRFNILKQKWSQTPNLTSAEMQAQLQEEEEQYRLQLMKSNDARKVTKS